MRWDEVCVFYAVKSEQSQVSEKHCAFQAMKKNATLHTGNCHWSIFADALIVIHCLQNQINELQWSISSAKSTSCRFWWESNHFIPSLFVQSSMHSGFHDFCDYFCRSCFLGIRIIFGFDSGMGLVVCIVVALKGCFLWAEDVHWIKSMAWFFSSP